MIPPKSILKNASSFQSTNYKKAPLPSPVSPDWFGNAAISITSTFNKIRKISNEPSPKTIHQKKLVKMKSDSSNDEDGLALAPTQEKDSKSIDSLNKSQRFVRFKYPNQTVEFSQAESDFDEMAKEFDASMTKNGTAIIIEKTEEDEATEFLSDALGKSVASALAAAASESRKNRGPQIILTANIIQPLNTAREIFNAYLGTCDRLNEAPLTLILDQFNQVFDDNRADLPLNKLDLSKIPLSNPVNLEMVSDLIKYSSKYLSSLNLEKTDLDDSSLMEILQNIVSFECPLSWLSLSNNNKIGLMGIKYISVFVKKSCFLKCLDLSGLIFDKNSMNFLAHAITIEKTNNEVASEFQRVWLSTLKLRNVKLDKYMLDILGSLFINISTRNSFIQCL